MDRIIDISYKYRLSHISSSLTTYPLLEAIYQVKNPNDLVVLSSGHAGLALYVALEVFEKRDAEALYKLHGTHPHRDPDNGICASSGSLGLGILVAVGLALADRSREVYCVVSDGECSEGSVWEALSFAHIQKLENLHVHVNANGYSAYRDVNIDYLETKLKAFFPRVQVWRTSCPDVPFMQGLHAHYHVMSASDKEAFIQLTSQSKCARSS